MCVDMCVCIYIYIYIYMYILELLLDSSQRHYTALADSAGVGAKSYSMGQIPGGAGLLVAKLACRNSYIYIYIYVYDVKHMSKFGGCKRQDSLS